MFKMFGGNLDCTQNNDVYERALQLLLSTVYIT